MENPTGRHSAIVLGIICVLTISATINGVGVVAAAGTTDVSVTPETQTIDAGTTTTVNITVADADGGIGAYNFTLSTSGTGTASITDVTPKGDPGVSTTDISDDGSSVTVDAALAETADTGPVTIATVTIAGDAAGESSLSLSVHELADEGSSTYSVGTTNDASVSVLESTAIQESTVSPTEVEEGQTVETTFEFSVADVSSDGNTDDFTLTAPDDVSFASPTVTVTDSNGQTINLETDPSLGDADNGSDNEIQFAIAPDNSYDTSSISVTVAANATYPEVTENQSASFELDVVDSSGETATDSTSLTITNTDSSSSATHEVIISPAEQDLAAGETTMYDVVLTNATDGVGAYDLNVTTNDASIATISDVEFGGNPSSSTTSETYTDEGATVSISAALADTADTGNVTVATITVQGESDGTTSITPTVDSIGDENGDLYTISGVSDAHLSVLESTAIQESTVSPTEVEEGQTVETTFEFSVADVSSDGNTDDFTLTAPDDVSFASPTVTVTDSNGQTINLESDPSLSDANSGTNNAIEFAIAPDNAYNTSSISVTVAANATYPEVTANQSTSFDLNVVDSTGETATASTSLTITNTDDSTGSESAHSVTVVPAETNLSVGGTTTYDVVLTNATNGVGAYDLNVTTNDANIATITSVEFGGNPPASTTTTNYADEEATVAISAALADTADTGNVTVATITVQGESDGTTSITPTVDSIGDEEGNSYKVSNVKSGTLHVQAPEFNTNYTISNETILAGDEVSVNATVVNVGDVAGSTAVTLYVDEMEVKNETVTVNAGNSTTVEFTTTFSEAGTHNVTVNDLEATNITVQQPATFNVDYDVPNATVLAGDEVSVNATVENVGDVAGSTTIGFYADSELITNETVSVDAGDNTTVEFTTTFSEAGTHNVTVNDLEATNITVKQVGPGDVTGNGDAATDPNGDGVYEDVNGDGSVSILDVQALFGVLDNSEIEKSINFDVNGDGSVNILDVQTLFSQL